MNKLTLAIFVAPIALAEPGSADEGQDTGRAEAIVVQVIGAAKRLNQTSGALLEIGEAIKPGEKLWIPQGAAVSLVFPSVSLTTEVIQGPTAYTLPNLRARIETNFEFAYDRAEGFNLRSIPRRDPFRLPGFTKVASSVMQLDFSQHWENVGHNSILFYCAGEVIRTQRIEVPRITVSRAELKECAERVSWCVRRGLVCTLDGEFQFISEERKALVSNFLKAVSNMSDDDNASWMLKAGRLINESLYLDAATILAARRDEDVVARRWLKIVAARALAQDIRNTAK